MTIFVRSHPETILWMFDDRVLRVEGDDIWCFSYIGRDRAAEIAFYRRLLWKEFSF